MTLNIFQIFILLGLLQGIFYISFLLGNKYVRSQSNIYLALLIFVICGNLGQYWLSDSGTITNAQMQLIFIPWQILVAPLVLIYIKSLRIFNFKSHIDLWLFAPFIVFLAFHLWIKILILNVGVSDWVKPFWVSQFYFIEELLSFVFSLGVSVLIYLTIRQQKQETGGIGFGVNKSVIKWTKLLVFFGFFVSLVWIGSLYVFQLNENVGLKNYYLLWIILVVVLNVLGTNGILNSYRHGGQSELVLSMDDQDQQNPSAIPKTPNDKSEIKFSVPGVIMDDERIQSLINLSTRLSKAKEVKSLNEIFSQWISEDFDLSEISFQHQKSHNKGIFKRDQKLHIPMGRKGTTLSLSYTADREFNETDLYVLNLAEQAYEYAEENIIQKSKKEKISKDSQRYIDMLKLLEKDHVYKDSSLDLNKLAGLLDISPGYLSKMIHDVTNRNFNDFINSYRIDEAKRLMLDPSYKDYSITGLGYEAGFNSKSTFYKYFKSIVGKSPKEFLQDQS